MSYRYIYSSKESEVLSSSPSYEFGGESSMNLGRGSTAYYRNLIYFDLSALVGLRLETVELILYQWGAIGDAATLNFTANCINQDWTESTVTWNNQPTYSTTAATSHTLSGTDEGWRIFDIKTLIEDILNNGRTYYGLMLVQNGTTSNTVKWFGTHEWSSQVVQLRYTISGTVGYGASGVYNDCEVYYGTGGGWQRCQPYYGFGGVYNETST